ncbi:uncharacterized protein GGS22DRAFT_122271 [Annulohypoxylon maeteangense]|uniref:uncharacterized protein n=1 Tax=Annulohypoxylon maeteangense TaxID=1927788 RepID=UPI0020087E70|nr:uncharacterized protein GGS22DRAFT_122271 [Annulohypoxylon maeteangense]KAI0885973.1 hypothetical protein GGS22DRAFT_122271 [Annulohypoxylon maeteangense]
MSNGGPSTPSGLIFGAVIFHTDRRPISMNRKFGIIIAYILSNCYPPYRRKRKFSPNFIDDFVGQLVWRHKIFDSSEPCRSHKQPNRSGGWAYFLNEAHPCVWEEPVAAQGVQGSCGAPTELTQSRGWIHGAYPVFGSSEIAKELRNAHSRLFEWKIQILRAGFPLHPFKGILPKPRSCDFVPGSKVILERGRWGETARPTRKSILSRILSERRQVFRYDAS